jgi:SAM-dependent methyltransferase
MDAASADGARLIPCLVRRTRAVADRAREERADRDCPPPVVHSVGRVIPTAVEETERVRDIQDKHASGYDRQMGFFDRVLFAGGRDWACSQAEGEVLEIALGTGRNLGHYPSGVKLTAIEFSPEMLAIARRRAE